jgi:hypothetical protein
MKIAIVASLFAKRYVYVDSSHNRWQTYFISKSQQFLYTFADMFRFTFTLFLAFVLCNTVSGQEKFTVKKDLADQWHFYTNNNYSILSQNEYSKLKSIHFNIETNQFPNDRLLIRSAKSFFVFINGKLIRSHTGYLLLPLDSVATANYSTSLMVTIFQDDINSKDLRTQIISYQDTERQILSEPKPQSYFKDFVIMAGLSLIIFFVVMLRLHPKLAADYFSVTRILSLREAEDNQSHARFAISSNVLFYIFSSLLLGLCLIILLYHLPEEYLLPLTFRAASFGGVLVQWLKLSTIILVILFSKILLIFSLSNLFGMRGIAGIHFFNWVRLLLIISGSLSTILFVYFISRGHDAQVYVVMLSVIVAALVGWIVIVFLKLNNRVEHSMFHLFSYICATEVIPLLLTIKVLFH